MKTEYDLEKLLDRTIDWLKFAETKNAGTLAFVSASLIVMPQGYKFFVCKPLFFIVIFILALIVAITIYSLLPKLNKLNLKRNKINTNPNLLYFKDISSMSLDSFRICLIDSKAYENEVNSLQPDDKYFIYITDQIWQNARIANNKFLAFKWSLYLMLALIILYISVFSVQIFCNIKLFNF